MVGLLAPEFEEVVTGEAEVREIFRVPRVGAIAGCYVRNGIITRGSKVRFLREGTIIWKGTITSLQAVQGRRPRGRRPASSAASASPTSRTSSRATSSRPSRSGRSPAPDGRVHARPAPLRIELHLPDVPLAEGEAGGGQADRRGRPAPLPRWRSAEVGPPGQVAAGRARRRGGVGVQPATPARCSTRSSASCGRSPRSRCSTHDRDLAGGAMSREHAATSSARRLPPHGPGQRAAPRDRGRGARADRRRPPRAGHGHRASSATPTCATPRSSYDSPGRARRTTPCSRPSPSTGPACRPPSAARPASSGPPSWPSPPTRSSAPPTGSRTSSATSTRPTDATSTS